MRWGLDLCLAPCPAAHMQRQRATQSVPALPPAAAHPQPRLHPALSCPVVPCLRSHQLLFIVLPRWCAGQLWLKRKKDGTEGELYDSKPARKILAHGCLGKAEPHTADISQMRLSPADAAYVEMAVSRGLSVLRAMVVSVAAAFPATGRTPVLCLPCATRAIPAQLASPAQPSLPTPLWQSRAQVEHYLKNGLTSSMPRMNDAAFKRAYKQRITEVGSRASPHIEWEPMEGAE